MTPIPSNESQRLATLRAYDILDTAAEQCFDDLTSLASHICGTPVALVSFIDADRQWLKSKVGISLDETPRDVAFCAHAIMEPELLVVTDAKLDARFRDNPFVVSEPHVRFYAGAPLITPDGHALGTVCAIDFEPRELTDAQRQALRALAGQAMSQIELRLRSKQITEANASLHQEIAERRLIEERLRERERSYRELVAYSMGLTCTQTLDGTLLSINPAAALALGYEPEELVGAKLGDLLAPSARHLAGEYLEQITRDGMGEGVVVFRHKNGEDRFWAYRNVVHNAAEESPYVICHAKDITEQKHAARRLRESEARLRSESSLLHALMDNLPDAIYFKDAASRFTRVNRAQAQNMGIAAPEEALGKTDFDFLPVDHAHAAFADEQLIIETGVPVVDKLFESIRQDGTKVWYSDTKAPIFDAAGSVVGFVGVTRDVTGRVGAEAERRRADEYRNLFRLANDAILIFEPESEIVLDVNDYACELYGIARERFIGTSLKRFTRSIESGEREMENLFADGNSHAFESTHFRIDGTPIHFLINAAVIEHRGRRAVLAINRDITERVAAECRLRESEERERRRSAELQAIMDAVPAAICIAHDPQCDFITGNLLAHELIDVPSGENLSLTPAESSPARPYRITSGGRELPGDELPMQIAARRGIDVRDFEMEIVIPDGTAYTVLVNAAPLRDADGSVRGSVAAFADITERKFAEERLRRSEEQLQQAQKMELVGQLAGGIAHDFNNLLTAIIGHATFLLDDLEPADPSREDAQDIKRAAERAAALTQQMLAFSRKQVLQPRELNLNVVISESEKMLRRTLGENIELTTGFDPSLDLVEADPNQIEQVILNLTINARDAMPDGGSLSIRTRNAFVSPADAARRDGLRPGRYVVMRVADTGCGIDEETQRQIFEPFFTTKPIGKGTGLGLSSVYGIVKQSGGDIRVESAPGEGTVFQIFLPRAAGTASTPEHAAADAPAPAIRQAAVVLVVEDEDGVRGLARRVLEKSGYTVLTAEHGAQALEVVADMPRPPDLILTDVVMPHIGGKELAARLKEVVPCTPLLFMSGYVEDVMQGGSPFEQMNFIRKPFTPEELVSAVRGALVSASSVETRER